MKNIATFGIITMCLLILTSCNVKNGNTKTQKSNDNLQIGDCFITESNGSSNKICFRIIGDTVVEVYRKSPFENLQEVILFLQHPLHKIFRVFCDIHTHAHM